MKLHSTTDRHGRKQIRLRLRQNLQLTPQTQGGQTCFVLKDPVTLRYFQFDESQRFLIGMMDGTHTLEEIRRAYEESHRPRRLSLDELEDFARQLLESNLVLNEAPTAIERTIELARQKSGAWWLSWINIFCVKIPLANPDPWLARCRIVGTVLFSSWSVAAAIAFFLAALGLVATHWQEFLARLPGQGDFFQPRTIILFWLTLGLVKVAHELGHGFCCQRMGAEVHEMGVLVLFFFPALYCNVSDGWTLPGKWKRIAISAAGIYVELIIASAATFLWWFSDANTLLHNFAFALMAVCSVNTVLCNANPLMRFDGYFMLADWLEIPNLAQRSTQAMQRAALRWLGVESAPADEKHDALLFWFGMLSAAYRGYIVGATLYCLAEFLKEQHQAALGTALVVLGLAMLIGTPVYQLWRCLRHAGRWPDMKTMRMGAQIGIAAALLAGFFFVPVPRKVRGVALVQVMPDQARRVNVPDAEGFLQEMRVRDGQHVNAGEVLAVLVNPKLEIKLRLNEADQALRHRQQQALLAELTETAMVHAECPADWQKCEQELRSLAQARQALQEQRDRLVLRAPVAGVVMGLPSLEEQGKWLTKGVEFCRIANPEALRALVVVDPAEHAEVHVGASALIRVHGGGSRQYPGFVTGVAQVEVKNLPAPLSSRVAGEVPTHYDAATNADQPRGQHYLVSVQFGESDAVIHPGVLGRVKIDAEARPLAWRLRRFLGTTFNWGL